MSHNLQLFKQHLLFDIYFLNQFQLLVTTSLYVNSVVYKVLMHYTVTYILCFVFFYFNVFSLLNPVYATAKCSVFLYVFAGKKIKRSKRCSAVKSSDSIIPISLHSYDFTYLFKQFHIEITRNCGCTHVF